MKSEFDILLLPGDGIGQEIMKEAIKVLSVIEKKFNIKINMDTQLIGGCSIDENGIPLTDDVIKIAKKSDAVLLGSVGGPKWDNAEIRPEVGLLKIRKELNVYANLRPIMIFDELIDSSTIKAEVIKDVDIMIIRELVGGLYFGEPRYRERISEIEEKACDAMTYTTSEINRIADLAFKIAEKRRKKLCSIDKANVLTVGRLWRDVVIEASKNYQNIKLSHMYVDNAAMQIIRDPRQFDVMVMENMFGDILSDLASQLTGSIGMLPSASLNYENEKVIGLYEPIHGSAPDIAGLGIANPLAMIMCLSMMFRYSFDREDIAFLIDHSVKIALKNGNRTKDIARIGEKFISTNEMGDAIVDVILVNVN